MAKNKFEKPQREVTKRQLSHWQREHKLQKIVYLAGALVIVAILVIVGVGIYLDSYKPFHTTVFKMEDKEYSMDYYIDMLTLISGGNFQTQYGDLTDYYVSYSKQQIEQSQIIIKAASDDDELNINISDNEVNQYIKDNKLVNSLAQKDLVKYQLTTEKIRDHFDQELKPAEQRNLQAMFLESQSQVDEIKVRLEKEEFAAIASEVSLETNSKEKGGDFGWLPEGVLPEMLNDTSNTTLEKAVFNSPAGVLSVVKDDNQTKQIGYWVLKVTETRVNEDTKNDELHLYAMLLGSKEEADQMILKLEGGADFVSEGKVSSKYEGAPEDGGDQGFVSKGEMGDAVDAIIFPENQAGLPLNTVSAPIVDMNQITSGGIWLFKVNSIEPNREIEGNSREILINRNSNNWGTDVISNNKGKFEDLLNPDQKDFAIAQVTKRSAVK